MASGSFVGLDIGSSQIKVVEARGGNGNVDITAIGIHPTPLDAYDNGVIVNAQSLGLVIKELLKQSGVSTKQVVGAATSPASVVVRVVDLPATNDTELAEQIKWETERQVPFPMSDIVMDYQKIERPEGVTPGQNVEVLLAVAEQHYIDQFVEVLSVAGLKPKYIDVVPLASGRSLLDINPNVTGSMGYTVAIVNIGATTTDIAIFRDKLLAFPRSVPLGGENFTRAISESLGVDMATAENYKCNIGEVLFNQQPQGNSFGGPNSGFSDFSSSGSFMDFGASPSGPTSQEEITSGPLGSPSGRMPFDFSNPTPPPSTPFDFNAGAQDLSTETAPDMGESFQVPVQEDESNLPATVPTDAQHEAIRVQVFNAIAPVLAELVQEIRRSFNYYQSKVGDAQVNEILLVGGAARLKKLTEFVEAEMGIPTRLANPLENVQVSSKNYSKEYLDEIAPSLSVSIGLAAYDLMPKPVAGSKKKK